MDATDQNKQLVDQIAELRAQIARLRAAVQMRALADRNPRLGSTSVAGSDEQRPEVQYHFGIMRPLITRSRGVSTAFDPMTGFPFGIFLNRGRLMFDFELMPMVRRDPLQVDLAVAPGLLYHLTKRIVVGSRLALEVKSAAVGFTPLFHYNLALLPHSRRIFTEIVLPSMLDDQEHRSVAHLGGKPLCFLLAHGSTFSSVGASGNPGAVQLLLVRQKPQKEKLREARGSGGVRKSVACN